MDKARKNQIKKIVTWVLMAALVAGLAAMPLLAQAEAESDGPVASILSGQVEAGSVSTALHGGGNVSLEDVEDITLPSGVKITEFLVKNGDRVTKGTPLAAVDTVSVMTAITEVTDTMEYLQEEMRSAKEQKVSSTVSATAGGRVKKLYAEKGDSVQGVMLEHGALALLSLDGLMAVEIQRKMELPTGQSVEVTLADGTTVSGRVESNLDGKIVITVEDEGYEIGQTVTVATNEGDRVGAGELYVHNAWSAVAYSGTIQTVYAKEESKIGIGASLFGLTDREFLGDLEYLASLHREYEDLMQELFRMYQSGTIDAPCDGTVSGVDKDSVHLLSAEEDGDVRVELLNAEAPKWTVVLLSNVVYEEGSCGSDTCSLKGEHTVETCPKNVCTYDLNCAANPDKHKSDCIFSCDHATTEDGCNGTGNHYSDCIKDCDSSRETGRCSATVHHHLTCIESCISSNGSIDCPTVGKHKISCIESCTHADNIEQCSADPSHYVDCIHSCIVSDSGNTVCPATKHQTGCFFKDMTFTAKVYLVDSVGTSALVVRKDSSDQSYAVEKAASGNWQFKTESDYNPSLLVKQDTLPISNPGAYQPGDVILVITGYKGTTSVWTGVAVHTKLSSGGDSGTTNGQMGNLSSMMGGMMGSMGGSGFTVETPVDETVLFDLEGSTLMTVSPETAATLTITLDEQDIAKVSPGQKATVKVEALGKETFEAEVMKISNHGENIGGSSKFTVKLRFAKAPDLLDGMSATAKLPLETLEDVPVIPVAALVQQGSKTMVYTALNSETGEPSRPVEVTTGISDGEYAQILEGLSLGDTYYYSYYDTLEVDTAA